LMTTMRVVGECFFWYRLTRVFPDKFHRAVKRLCVCVCVTFLFGRHWYVTTSHSLVTYLRCGKIFNNHFTANLHMIYQWKNFENRYDLTELLRSLVSPFLWDMVYILSKPIQQNFYFQHTVITATVVTPRVSKWLKKEIIRSAGQSHGWHEKCVWSHRNWASVSTGDQGETSWHRFSLTMNHCVYVSPFESNIATYLNWPFDLLLFYCMHMLQQLQDMASTNVTDHKYWSMGHGCLDSYFK